MSLYADTSLLVSYYITDANSAHAQTIIHSLADPLAFSGLHRLELRNAFALGVFRRLLTSAQVRTAWSDVERDLQAGRLEATGLNWAPIFRVAAQMAGRFSATAGARSLDVLHVASASRLGATEFFSFDTRQRTLAQHMGLTVKP